MMTPVQQAPQSLAELSKLQGSLLRTALRDGYFKSPRETTLVQLASQHGISDSEASTLLRSALDVSARDALAHLDDN